MDLDNLELFHNLDTQDMLAHIDGLPGQLAQAYKLGSELPLGAVKPIKQLVVAGMGGSAIGADLLAACLADRIRVPFIVHRDYDLPAFASGEDTLVVVSSHSGNTEESLSAFEMACQRGCQVAAITTGGMLQQLADQAGVPAWKFDHIGQPRTAVGFSFGLLLRLLERFGLIDNLSDEMEEAEKVMVTLQERIKADVVVLNNPAKRQAGQMVGRHVTIFGSGFMAPVARRWKSEINEVAKAVASFEVLPEADHNTLAGVYHPQELAATELAIFLKASADHPRNQLRNDLTRQIFMLEGIGTDFFNAKGQSRMAQMWSTLLFGDYISYYLAMAYGVDPTPIPPIAELKDRLSG